MRKVFLDNLKHYKDILSKAGSPPSKEHKNTLTYTYFILTKMYEKYGCPNCEHHRCGCNVIPDPHPCINMSGW